MAKTMNAGPAELPGNDAKASGASFLEVLAGTSALFSLPSLGPLPQATGSGAQQNSPAPDQGAPQTKSQDTSNSGNPQAAQNDLPQTSLAGFVPAAQTQPAAQTVISSAQSRPTTTATDRAAQHKDDTRPSSTPLPAQITLPVPVAPPIDTIIAQPVAAAPQANSSNTQSGAATPSSDVENAQPVPTSTAGTTAPASVSGAQQFNTLPDVNVLNAQQVDALSTAKGTDAQPVSSPDAQQAKADSSPAPTLPLPASPIPDQVQTPTAKHTQADFAAAAATRTITTQSIPAGRADSQGQTKVQTPALKNATADAKPATQITQSTSSQPAGTQTTGNSNAADLPAAIVLPSNIVLPGVNVMPAPGDPSLPAVKAAQGAPKAPDTSFTKLPDATTASDAKNNEPSTLATSSNNSSNGATNNGPTAQRAQGDGSQPAPTAPKPADAGAAQAATQIQSSSAHTGAHDAGGSPSRTDGTAETVRAGDHAAAAETAENAATGSINTANVIQKMGETEMRIGVRSADFGDVSIRTSVSQQQMTAQISVDHSDLGKAISAHIPAMEAKLGGDFGVRALVEVNQSGMSFSGDRGFSSQREQKSYAQVAQDQVATGSADTEQPAMRISTGPGEAYRLDIRI